jgi:hypothetical protein
MTSFVHKPKRSAENESRFCPKVASFTINPPNTTLHIQRSINLLTSLENQDLFKYRTDFYEVANLCKWSEETSNEVLISLTSSELLKHYKGCSTTIEKFNSLLRAKYPPTDSLKYYTQLTLIKQNDYLTILEYKDQIEKVCMKLAACKQWNEQTLEFKREEIFYNGLTKRTQLEMSRLNVKNLGEMYQIIHTTECTMIEQMNARLDKKHFNEPNKTEKTYYKNNARKYCTYHHSTSHNTDECYSKKKNESNNNNKSTNMAIKEPKTAAKCIEMDSNVNNKQVKILFDTGSVFNYANENLVNTLNVTTTNIEEVKVEMANGNSLPVNKSCDVKLQLQADTTVNYEVNLRLLKNLTTDIILGMDFMLLNDVVINMKEKIISINNKHYEILEHDNTYYENERFLADKTSVMNINTEQLATKMVKEYMLNNPTLGKISSVEHVISLKDEKPVICKPYPIPIMLQENSRSELRRLLQLGVIK